MILICFPKRSMDQAAWPKCQKLKRKEYTMKPNLCFFPAPKSSAVRSCIRQSMSAFRKHGRKPQAARSVKRHMLCVVRPKFFEWLHESRFDMKPADATAIHLERIGGRCPSGPRRRGLAPRYN